MENQSHDLDRAFHALADPTRRAVVARLGTREALPVSELAAPFEMGLPAFLKHLRVLEEAGLVVPVRKGRERFNHLDAIPIQALHARWIGPHAERAAEGLLQLKSALEDKAEITTGE